MSECVVVRLYVTRYEKMGHLAEIPDNAVFGIIAFSRYIIARLTRARNNCNGRGPGGTGRTNVTCVDYC